MRSRKFKSGDANNATLEEPENLSSTCGVDLIQIPDEPMHHHRGDRFRHRLHNNYDEDDCTDTSADDDDEKSLHVADKHLPINMSIRRRNNETKVPLGAATSLAQPILLLDEFLRSKALPAKKRKLTIADEIASTTPNAFHNVLQQHAAKPSGGGGDSPFHQQPVSTSTPTVGGSRMIMDNDNSGSGIGVGGDSDSSTAFASTAMLQLGIAGVGGGGGGLLPTTGLSTPTLPIDDDYHFLLSLHPYMVKLNDTQKLRLRMKIQGIVYEELYNED